jgi:hypothetical protein
MFAADYRVIGALGCSSVQESYSPGHCENDDDDQ